MKAKKKHTFFKMSRKIIQLRTEEWIMKKTHMINNIDIGNDNKKTMQAILYMIYHLFWRHHIKRIEK